MKRLIKWPSIGQIRHAIQNVVFKSQFTGGLNEEMQPVLDTSKPLPSLMYRGTVKIHGTNGSVLIDYRDGDFWVQSREEILSWDPDNSGFCKWVDSVAKPFLREMLDQFKAMTDCSGYNTFAIYGEWAGRGIQGSVAVSDVDPFFTIFGVARVSDQDDSDKIWYSDEETYQVFQSVKHRLESPRVFHVFDFPVFYEKLDFSNISSFESRLTELVLEVEKNCPVGLFFGKTGVGEGIVWSCVEGPEWFSAKFRFKLKGPKHQVSKTKKVVSVDVELQKNINSFVEYSCTENRLLQGLDVALRQKGKKFTLDNIGDFILWVIGDILKEESDVLTAHQLDRKQVNKAISTKAKHWYLANMQKY